LNARPKRTIPRGEEVLPWRRWHWIGIAAAASIALILGGSGYWALRPARSTPEVIWDRAQENLRAGRYDEAGTDLARLGRLRAPTPLDWYLRAQLARARNQPDAALDCLAQVPDDVPIAARSRLLVGQIERQRDRLRLAEEALRAAVRIDPSLVTAHRALIYIYGMHLRRLEISREYLALQRLTGLGFDEVCDWTALLNNYWDPGLVVADLTRFVAADPGDRWSRLALAENLRRMGQQEHAESTLSVLADRDPEANAVRVRIALDRQDNVEAERLLALDRGDEPILACLRGRQALARGDARAAVQHFRIAYAADPGDHETLFGLRAALELLGDEGETKPVREAARNLDRLNTLLQRARTKESRVNPDLMREFGTACADLHRDGEARAWLELAIAKNPLDTQAQQLLFRLNAGRGNARHSPVESRE
jgi:tetratricopeptide (TPR) repeat protein